MYNVVGDYPYPIPQRSETLKPTKLASRSSQDRFKSCGPHRQIDYTFFREDLVDLKKEHLMAIADFCVDKIMGLQDNNTYQTEKAKKYRDVATNKAFERYWQKCKKNYGWDKKLPSPYEAYMEDEMEE